MTADELKHGLQKALDRGQEGYTLSYLETELAMGNALLWRGLNSALVTSLHKDEDGFFIHVWLGTGSIKELLEMEPGVSAWARARGCRYASIDGRKGWSRVFKQKGFQLIDGELRKNYV